MQAKTLPWLMLSGVAHGALAVLFASLEWEDLPMPAVEPLEVTLLEPVHAPAVEPVHAPAEPSLAPTVSAAPAKAASKPVRPTSAASAPVESNAPLPTPVVVERPPSVAIPSARAAALSTMELEPGGVLDAGIDMPKGPRRGQSELALEDAITRAVNQVDTRPDPTLKPRAGGGYTFRGNGFSALIATDGSVHMVDNFRDASWIFRPSAGEDGLAAGFKFFSVKFDIFKRLDRALGNDPFQSERRWFLDRTRTLREDMAAHYLDQRIHSRRDE
ncbi:MAG TPA: hypothetical protein VFX59_27365 [Polyangiales bacterium]|nr:hypothetical protein [Polyangiales bacterium]